MLNVKFIRERREKLGLTQAEAATAAGLGNRHIWNRIERGNRPNATPGTLMKIAKALQCPLAKLFVDPPKVIAGFHCGKAAKNRKTKPQ